MDIKISIVLKDKTYGFSDLLDGRELNDQTKQEIIELIKEDIGYVFDQQIEVEQLFIPDVSQQRELLNALADNFNESTHTYVGQPMIDETLKAFNCG
jgi:hypothetical protein